MMRVLVCGGREFNNAKRLWAVLDSYDAERDFSVLIEGAARGADTLARHWAEAKKIPVRSFPANWARDGKAAGPLRNQRMIDEGKPDIVIAFPGGRGTSDMVRRAKAHGIEIVEV